MRLTTILLLTTITISVSGQRLTGKYGAYYGHSLELKDDSTFKYEWRFDLIKFWAVGQWSYSDNLLNLKFTDIYDTLKRPNRPDSIVLSFDEKSTRLNHEEFVTSQLISGGQKHGGITNKLVFKRRRLYLADNKGRIVKGKQSGIMTKKKRPTWYFRTD